MVCVWAGWVGGGVKISINCIYIKYLFLRKSFLFILIYLIQRIKNPIQISLKISTARIIMKIAENINI